MWQTWDAFGGAFRAQCAQNGLRIDGKTVRRRVPDTLAAKGPFCTYGGDPLTEFVKHMFKWSSNFVSEMLFKTMGVRKFGEPGSWPKGVSAVEDWWQSRGLPGRPQIINGSGMGSARPPRRAGGRADRADGVEDTSYASAPALSGTENFISAGQMVALLTYVSKQKSYFPDYLSAFPVAGVDGTLRSRFNKSKLKGVVRGKTGTLNSVNVSTLAGYMLLDDKTYAFAVFCVGPKQYDNWTLQEQVLETVARVAGW
jgi:D-alanyl-D-alanine carboxypeptidase